jgi:biopolymer transport protein ExbB
MTELFAEISLMLARGGWVAYALVAISMLLWIVAVLRAFALRSGFTGSLADLVARCTSAGACAPAHDDPHAGVVVRFVHHAALTMRHPDACNHDLDRWSTHERDRTESFAALLHALVAAAPLLGLLGTVSGMIETFASLHGASGHIGAHASEHTVAGGISIALITTQLGLVIGIPGLVVARLLDRLAAARRRELQAARALLAESLGRLVS